MQINYETASIETASIEAWYALGTLSAPSRQQPQLGVTLGPVHVSSVGQADDVALASNCPHKLQGLLTLAMKYLSYEALSTYPIIR